MAGTGRAAFTLLEVMLAIGLILLLSGGVYGFLWNLLGQRDRVTRTTAEARAAGVIIERLEADLFGALASARGEAGIAGDGASVRVMGRAVMVPVGASGASPEEVAGDLAGSEMAFNRFTGVVRARRIVGGGGAWEDVSGHVQRLRFRYFDGRAWRSMFDSKTAGRLPAAIEVALWFGDPLERSESDGEPAVPGDAEPRPAADEDAGDGAPRSPADDGSFPVPTWAPDRVRVIVVPDGPSSAWRENR